MSTWTDEFQAYSAVASAIVSLLSIAFIVVSLRQAASALLAQNRSTDVASVISLFERLDDHWRRFKASDAEPLAEFEFGQLVSYYELGCRLFRDKIFQTQAALTLYEHMHDVLSLMQMHDDFKERFDSLKNQSDNFENILWLCSQPRSLHPDSGKQWRSITPRWTDIEVKFRRR